jgi:[ribosomal protein S5]-alanine N-acetyltransferase
MQSCLRKWQATDISSLVKHANDFEVSRFLTDKFPNPYTHEDGLKFLEIATNPANHIFAIDIGGEAVGGMGIHLQTDVMRKNAEVGFWLGREHWGKGIASKHLPELIDYAFSKTDIARLYARTYGNNTGSQKVLEKTGFVLEAHLKDTIYKNEVFLDELIYAVRRR